MFLRVFATMVVFGSISLAQNQAPGSAPLASPVAHATATLSGKNIDIRYNAPSMRGRKVMGGLIPFGQVWRTGANDATSLVTAADLTIGDLQIPAGSYTIYTLPNADPEKWQLIINRQTGQWGLTYDQSQDLGRLPMHYTKLPKPQEAMSISFENRSDDGQSAELHIRWETTDEWVRVVAK